MCLSGTLSALHYIHTFGIPVVTMEAEEDFFSPLWVQSNNSFLVSLLISFWWSTGIWSEVETDCWIMHTDVPKRLTFLDNASYVCENCCWMWSQDSFLLQNCITPPSLLQRVAKATFSKCLGTVFKKSCAIEDTQAIGNILFELTVLHLKDGFLHFFIIQNLFQDVWNIQLSVDYI